MRKAVIDIGTNSTRLYVCDISDKVQDPILKMLSTTRLGEGILSSDSMLEKPMARTSDTVRDFVNIAKEKGAEEIYIYATAVVRESKNKDVFSKMIYDKTGLLLDIIPGAMEGEIAFIGAAGTYPHPAVIDIGGGSTEVVTKEDNILKALSQKTGAVRVKEKFQTQSGIVDIVPIKDFIKKTYLEDYKTATDILSAKTLIGVSGTPTTLFSLALGLKEYTPKSFSGKAMSKAMLDKEIEKLASMTHSERKDYSGEFASRADVIVFGGCILSAFMEYYNFESITVSDRDSLEGYIELNEI